MFTQKQTPQYTPLLYRIVTPIMLVCITVATYYPSLYYNFQFDDIANIQKHFYIRHHQFKSLFLTGARWISYWLNSLLYNINKFEPFWYRVSSLTIHLANGVLIFFVLLFALSRCYRNPFFRNNSWQISLTTTMLFLLHPVQTQTVSYVIQGQLEGLACMFMLAMILAFLHMSYAIDMRIRAMLFGVLMMLAVISCGTKEIAIMSPFLIMLIDWFFVAHGSLPSFKKRWWVHGLLFLVVTSLYVYWLKPSFFTNILGLKVTAKNNIGNIITQEPHQSIHAWPFFISQFKVILHYIWIFIWPFNISVEYDWVLVRGFFAWDCIFPLLALLAIGGLVIRVLLCNSTNIWCFGALWFFICLAPRSSIIPSPELLVDYKTYTASMGWLLIIASALVKLIDYIAARCVAGNRFMTHHQAGLLLSCMLLFPLSFSTWYRNLVWSSGSKFWMSVIKNAPGKARAYNNYGVELSQNLKMYKEAIPYFKKATQMDGYYPDPLNNLAVCYSFLNQIDNAIEALKHGLRINRFYPEGHNNLGSFYLQQKMYTEAEESLLTAIQLRPYYGKAYINMGRLYAAKGDIPASLSYFKKACTIADLDNEFGYKIYGQAAAHQKEFSEAIWAFTKTLECNPDDLESMFSLANCYYMTEKYEMSANTYKQLLSVNDDMRAWYNLGECYFALDDVVQAYQCFKHVEPHWQQIPQVRLKLASCYEKTNDPLRAHQELRSFSASPQAPVQLKVKAKELIAKLEEHYPQIKAVGLMT